MNELIQEQFDILTGAFEEHLASMKLLSEALDKINETNKNYQAIISSLEDIKNLNDEIREIAKKKKSL